MLNKCSGSGEEGTLIFINSLYTNKMMEQRKKYYTLKVEINTVASAVL